jgi:tetratricopeptide (TPR) repeat protein
MTGANEGQIVNENGNGRGGGYCRVVACAALVISLAVSLAALGAPSPPIDPAVQALVNQLGADDPALRQQAARELVARGRAARPALIEAMNGDDPQLRGSASELILKLPFDQPEDAPGVAGFLQRYGQAVEPGTRVSYFPAITSAAGSNTAAARIFLRLIREDPSDDVRWAIVGQFRNALGRRSLADGAAAVDTSSSRAANLALAGWAREGADPRAALNLYRLVAEAERERPSSDNGQADFVYQALFAAAVEAKEYERAAGVLRDQHARPPGMPVVDPFKSTKLDDLFAVHAMFGPLGSFGGDVAAYPEELGRPQALYAVGWLCERRAGRPLLADAMYRAGFAQGALSPAARAGAGEFLTNHRWDTLAVPVLEAAVVEAGAPQHQANGAGAMMAINARLKLGTVLARRGDDRAAAQTHQAALEQIAAMRGGLTRVRNERRTSGKTALDAAWAEVHWRFFRAARAKDDRAAMDEQLETLLTFDPDEEQIAFDVIPALIERGRGADADRFFERAYAISKASLEEHPGDLVRMNNFAWLCARAGRRLDEGLKVITAAIEGKPENASHLDTAADIHYQLGHVAEAIRLESRALELRPGDEFITKQIKRYREGKAGGAAPVREGAVD